jgi:hypothetical protein
MSCLYLKKAVAPQPISFCSCGPEEALIATPEQLNCPWCGCGWLFVCTLCRAAFTIATAIESPKTLRELVTADAERFYESSPPSLDDINERLGQVALMLENIVPGKDYVYLDGRVHEVGNPVNFTGRYGSHSLHKPPHGEPGATYESLRCSIGRDYWLHSAGKPPNSCCRCGELWPRIFMVPDKDWEKYTPDSEQDKMICWECFKQSVNHAGGELPKPRWI